jgi:hypothetical protein
MCSDDVDRIKLAQDMVRMLNFFYVIMDLRHPLDQGISWPDEQAQLQVPTFHGRFCALEFAGALDFLCKENSVESQISDLRLSDIPFCPTYVIGKPVNLTCSGMNHTPPPRTFYILCT